MRLSKTSARCASFVALAALFAGCSTSQGSSALPGSVGSTQPMGRQSGPPHFMKPNRRIGPISGLRLFQLQAEGKLPAPASRKVIALQIKAIQGHRPKINLHGKAGSVGIWVVNQDDGYLIGTNKSGKKAIATINAEANGCYYPVTVKIDSSQNIWNACEYNSSYEYGVVSEYNSSGTLQHSYTPSCPSPVSMCDYWYSYSFDGASDGSHVFAALPFTEEEVCNPSCAYEYGSGFEWWNAGDPSGTPTYINLGENCDPVCDVYYMDVDTSGNLWFTYYGYSGEEYGYGLAEITSPTTDPTFVSQVATGTYDEGVGVYVSNGGSKLNVTDASTRLIYQYALPFVTGESPTELGPTAANFFGYGEPISGGFNQADTKLAEGDGDGWLDVGTVASDKWKAIPNVNFGGYVSGAAYTPSDK